MRTKQGDKTVSRALRAANEADGEGSSWLRFFVMAMVASAIAGGVGFLWGVHGHRWFEVSAPAPAAPRISVKSEVPVWRAQGNSSVGPSEWIWQHGQSAEPPPSTTKSKKSVGSLRAQRELPPVMDCGGRLDWVSQWSGPEIKAQLRASSASTIENWAQCFPKTQSVLAEMLKSCGEARVEVSCASLALFFKAEALAQKSITAGTPSAELSEAELVARLGLLMFSLNDPKSVAQLHELGLLARERHPDSTFGFKAYLVEWIATAGEGLNTQIRGAGSLAVDQLIQDLARAEPSDENLQILESLRRLAQGGAAMVSSPSDLYAQAMLAWPQRQKESRDAIIKCVSLGSSISGVRACEAARDRLERGDGKPFSVAIGLPLQPPVSHNP